jgi:hypothetical protein
MFSGYNGAPWPGYIMRHRLSIRNGEIMDNGNFIFIWAWILIAGIAIMIVGTSLGGARGNRR